MGYKFLDILEVYEYLMTKYGHTYEGGLYKHVFILKTDVIVYPSCVRNPQDEERYVENFYAREDVRLDRDAIRPNYLNVAWQKYI